MQVYEKTLQILTKYPLCDNCLGRQFGLLGKNLTNKERGMAIKTYIILNEFQKYVSEKNEESIQVLKVLAENGMSISSVECLKNFGVDDIKQSDDCYLCSNIFQNLSRFSKLAIKKLDEIEFESYLVGSIIPQWLIEKEDSLRSEFSIVHGEALRAELNREVGKLIFYHFKDKEVVFDFPNVVVLINPIDEEVILNIHPIFIRGFYKKLVRGIPQTKWTCNACNGKGCEECNFLGKRYPTSVSELIGHEILRITQGKDLKFHGSGREDIDALMLGNGREFIIEIKEPKKRIFDLNELRIKINEHGRGKIEVSALRFSSKDEVRKIKAMAPFRQKTYRALVQTENEIDENKLRELELKFTNMVLNQHTPQRVLHRRANKMRVKKIFNIKTRKIAPKQFEIIVTAEGGTYIKELISGDDGRTSPSISSILSNKATCVELDVINIQKEL
ncbi:MAG: tRNA pseudouridine(54/55) synthase Pus10 [Candidatus Helarchaeota archaeon]